MKAESEKTARTIYNKLVASKLPLPEKAKECQKVFDILKIGWENNEDVAIQILNTFPNSVYQVLKMSEVGQIMLIREHPFLAKYLKTNVGYYALPLWKLLEAMVTTHLTEGQKLIWIGSVGDRVITPETVVMEKERIVEVVKKEQVVVEKNAEGTIKLAKLEKIYKFVSSKLNDYQKSAVDEFYKAIIK